MVTVGRSRTRAFQSFTSFISTPDFVNDEGHQAHSYPDLLVNLGVVGLHGDPNIFYEALQHLKGKAVMNSYTALVLGFAGETRPFPVTVHPTPHTIPQGAPLVQHCSPQPLLRPTGAHLSTPQPWPPQHLSFLTPQSSPSMCGPAVSWNGPLSGGHPPLTCLH